jgi:hypothetical protein
MKKIDLGQTITIFANIGVIGGLIFVGFQLRQDRVIARIESAIANNDSKISSLQLRAQNADVWVRGLAGDSLSGEETVIFDALAESYIQFFLSNFLRNRLVGSAENEDRWVREAAFDITSNPGLLAWWQRSSDRAEAVTPNNPWESAVNDAINRLKDVHE